MARLLSFLTLIKLHILVLLGKKPKSSIHIFHISRAHEDLLTLGYLHAAQSLQDSLTFIEAHDLRQEA